MQPSGLPEYFRTRAQIEVVGVAEYDLCVYVVAELAHVHSLDRPHGAYRHEYRGLDLSVVGGD